MARHEEFNVGIQAAVPEVSRAASNYARTLGLPPRADSFNNVVVDLPQARRMAADFLAAPDYDPKAAESFKAMAEETKRQYEHMTKPVSQGGLGIVHEVVPHDPYKSSREMMADVANGRIRTLATATTGPHPVFTNDENDMFRAVHDVFGHAGSGRNFNASGEEAAFRSHYSMFTPAARPAMATETRGQNSVNNFGGLKPGEFIQNKIATIPSTGIILPAPKRLVVPEGRRTKAMATGIAEAAGMQDTAIREHSASYGTPGSPHPQATWIR